VHFGARDSSANQQISLFHLRNGGRNGLSFLLARRFHDARARRRKHRALKSPAIAREGLHSNGVVCFASRASDSIESETISLSPAGNVLSSLHEDPIRVRDSLRALIRRLIGEILTLWLRAWLRKRPIPRKVKCAKGNYHQPDRFSVMIKIEMFLS